jgi:hypothetical protein
LWCVLSILHSEINLSSFLDIIPLAKKLKDCGVFGVSSDEYRINRRKWEVEGPAITAEMIERLNNPENGISNNLETEIDLDLDDWEVSV